ncbi:immunoglobulin superfamily member 1-like [Macrochelys suwanniensis]
MVSALTVLLLGCWLAGHSGVWGAGREFLKPTIRVSPSRVVALGGNVTIRCEGRYRSMKFFLRKAGHPNPQVQTVPDGTVAEFPIPSVSREDGGSYTCEYHSITEQNRSSYPSDPVEIIVAEPSYPKPSISLSPSGGVSLGGIVAVWCRVQRPGMRFVLNKERRHFPLVDSEGFQASFSIRNVSREDGGSYSCSYHSTSEPVAVSYPSDPVELVVRDPSLPRPSISLSPTWVTAPGADVTIRCQGQRRDVRFFLHEARDLNPQRHMDPAGGGGGAEFRVPTVGRQHGGNYSCSYRPLSEPFVSLQPSDPVQLVVTEPTLPKPSVSVHPSRGVTPGGNATIRCQAQPQNATFLLYKDRGYWRRAAPMGDVAEFPMASAGWEDAGSYSCSYHTTREPVAVSHPSDPARLVVRDYTRGNIVRLALSAGVLLGLTLILAEAAHGWRRGSWLCSDCGRFGLEIAEKPSDGKKGAERIMGFLGLQSLFRSHSGLRLGGARHRDVGGSAEEPPTTPSWRLFSPSCSSDEDWNYLTYTDPAGSEADFPITSARREHGGNYTCLYSHRTGPAAYSEPSDPVQIIVAGCWLAGHSGVWGAGREYPKPTIWVSPSRVVALGGSVTIRCEGRYQSMEFFLRKAGHPNPQVQTVPDGTVAEFPIPSVGREDGGSYTCEYHPITEQNRSSHPSDPVEIIIGEPSYPKPSISLSPSGGVSLGRAVAVWCRGQRQGVRFVLNKERRHFTPVDSDGSEVVFSISNVRWEHDGSYSCSYHSTSEPFAVSYPSDPVELVVRDPSLPRPSISLSPTGVTTSGADVTIRCQGQRRDVRFFLHKAGDLNPQRHMDPAGDGAEFRIPTVGRQHGGSYSCSYRPRSEPFVSSQPSDPVQLVVTEPTLPKPSVSVRPSQGVAPGGAATIRCRARPQNATFLLYKDGGYWGGAVPVGDVAEFPVTSAGWEDAGSYSCSYHTTREPVAVSHPSDPTWLVVRDYTRGNIVRLALSAGVLLGLALILAEAAHGWRRGRR